MVEHTFGRPEMEAEWNAWYADYLKVLVKIPGFQTGQRFKIAGSNPPQYMAMYTVESGDVFESAVYKSAGGGGNASARFRPGYKEWRRNLFELDGLAPAVPEGSALAVADRATPGGAPFNWLRNVGFHRTTPWRGLAVLSPAECESLSAADPGTVTVYTPITMQLAQPRQ